MTEAGLYSESARAFFERQQRRRHERQVLGDQGAPQAQPQAVVEPDEPAEAIIEPDEAVVEPDGPDEAVVESDEPDEATVSPPESTSVMTATVRYRARVVSDGHPDAVFDVQDGTTVGRAPEVDIRIDHPDVSRHHARFALEDDLLTIVDLGSTNGTAVNDASLEPQAPVAVAPGDTIQIGSPDLLLELEQE
jgi:hypothetical protein